MVEPSEDLLGFAGFGYGTAGPGENCVGLEGSVKDCGVVRWSEIE